MRPAFLPATAAVLVHIALIAAVMHGLSDSRKADIPPTPVSIVLLPSRAPAPLPIAPAAPPPEQHKRAEPKPPRVAPRLMQEPAPRRPEPSTARPPAPSALDTPAPAATPAPTQTSSALPPPAAPAPSSPAPAARTSVSVATYAASNRKPPYPRLSRLNDEQGTVVLRVLVKADGTAGNVEIKTSSGYPLLDESARSTVQTWNFIPATVDGKPVAEWYQVAIPFTLQNN